MAVSSILIGILNIIPCESCTYGHPVNIIYAFKQMWMVKIILFVIVLNMLMFGVSKINNLQLV